MKAITITLFTLLIPALHAAGRTHWYEIDYDKSQIGFLAKSRVVNANGLFRKWHFKGKISGTLHVVGDLEIDCNSIDTDNERRDKHLRSADFFDCGKIRQHTFRIRTVKPDNANALKATKYEVHGELTLRGTTQNVEFTLTREGNENAFSLTGSVLIDREKFGITYNSALNPIEKIVRIDIRVALKKKAEK
ncbi:MAG: YceI family protein [Leptospiraceae bacterium]|nr:YceI family protein [Leptospiraceae bacterium]